MAQARRGTLQAGALGARGSEAGRSSPAPRPFPGSRALGPGQRCWHTASLPLEGHPQEAPDPWWRPQAQEGSMPLGCVGGSEEGRREEAGFLKPPHPPRQTNRQTDSW